MTTTPTQTAHPWRATLRTAVEVGIPAIVGLLIILPQIIQAILEGMGETMPTSLYAWLAGAAAFVTALAATLARLAAIPGVVEWTQKYLSFLAPDASGKLEANPLIPTVYDGKDIPVGKILSGYVAYSDGSESPIERWIRRSDGAFISLDSERGPEWFDDVSADRFVQVI